MGFGLAGRGLPSSSSSGSSSSSSSPSSAATQTRIHKHYSAIFDWQACVLPRGLYSTLNLTIRPKKRGWIAFENTLLRSCLGFKLFCHVRESLQLVSLRCAAIVSGARDMSSGQVGSATSLSIR